MTNNDEGLSFSDDELEAFQRDVSRSEEAKDALERRNQLNDQKLQEAIAYSKYRSFDHPYRRQEEYLRALQGVLRESLSGSASDLKDSQQLTDMARAVLEERMKTRAPFEKKLIEQACLMQLVSCEDAAEKKRDFLRNALFEGHVHVEDPFMVLLNMIIPGPTINLKDSLLTEKEFMMLYRSDPI